MPRNKTDPGNIPAGRVPLRCSESVRRRLAQCRLPRAQRFGGDHAHLRTLTTTDLGAARYGFDRPVRVEQNGAGRWLAARALVVPDLPIQVWLPGRPDFASPLCAQSVEIGHRIIVSSDRPGHPFEALRALQIIVASLALVVSSTLLAAGACVLVIGLAGWLFWKLVRVMGRIQAGDRRHRDPA